MKDKDVTNDVVKNNERFKENGCKWVERGCGCMDIITQTEKGLM